MTKQKLTLSVEAELIKFARHLRLNLSAFLEEHLRDLKNNYIWARPDSNRGPSPRKGDVITTRPRALKVILYCNYIFYSVV